MATRGRLEQFWLTYSGLFDGVGPNPYKYPVLPKSTGLELCQVIQDNEDLLDARGKKIANPVFAADSLHDQTLKTEGTMGIVNLLKNYVSNGLTFFISDKVLRPPCSDTTSDTL